MESEWKDVRVVATEAEAATWVREDTTNRYWAYRGDDVMLVERQS